MRRKNNSNTNGKGDRDRTKDFKGYREAEYWKNLEKRLKERKQEKVEQYKILTEKIIKARETIAAIQRKYN